MTGECEVYNGGEDKDHPVCPGFVGGITVVEDGGVSEVLQVDVEGLLLSE